MRTLIFLAVVMGLLLAGVVGFVVVRESKRGSNTAASTAGSFATDTEIATISTGERVEIAACVPPHGHTIVMFTADF